MSGLHWSCLSGYHARLFQPTGPKWEDLVHDSHAELVKVNPLRKVFRVRFQGTDLYAKIYLAPNPSVWLKWCLRGWPSRLEFQRLQNARLRSVPVARPLAWARGWIKGHPLAILLTESLGEVISLEDVLWQEPQRDEQCNSAVIATAELVGRLHCAGIEHRDLHPGNILLAKSCAYQSPQIQARQNNNQPSPKMQAYITDLQNLRIEQRSGHRSANPQHRWRMANLGTLLAALQHRLRQDQLRLFVNAYLQSVQPYCRWSSPEQDNYLQHLKKWADKHDRRIWARHDRRALRNSKYSQCIRLNQGWSARVFLQCKHPVPNCSASHHHYSIQDWHTALADPNSLTQTGELLKQGTHNTVMAQTLTVGKVQLRVVAKHYRLHKGLRRCWQSFQRSRATRQWHRAHALITRQLPTAWPLAALERRRRFLLQESIYLCERIPNSSNLYNMIRTRLHLPQVPAQRIQLARQLGHLLAHLRRRGFRHRDCKATNIMVQYLPDQTGSHQLYLVDLDGLRLRLPPFDSPRHEAIIRLAASALSTTLRPRDFIRVFRAYIRALDMPETNNRVLRHRLWQRLSRQVSYLAQKTLTPKGSFGSDTTKTV